MTINVSEIKTLLVALTVVGVPIFIFLLRKNAAVRRVIKQTEAWLSSMNDDLLLQCNAVFKEASDYQAQILLEKPDLIDTKEMTQVFSRMGAFRLALTNPPADCVGLERLVKYTALLNQLEDIRDGLQETYDRI